MLRKIGKKKQAALDAAGTKAYSTLKRKKPKKKSTGRKQAPTTKQVDKLWSLVVRQRALYECELWGCGNMQCGSVMDAHHIFPRKHISTRWDLDNGLCLCKGHHLFYVHGNNGCAAADDIREVIGAKRYSRIKGLHYKTVKNTAALRTEVYELLTAEMNRLKEGVAA